MGLGEQYELETTGNIQSGHRKYQVSECCQKPVKVGGTGIGPGSTHWYECTGCGKPTDIVIVEQKP